MPDTTVPPARAPRPAVAIARQPILDRAHAVVGYELLCRSVPAAPDGNRATASVLAASFMDLGLDRVVGGRRAFINVTREFVLAGAAHALPADRVVLEILEDVEVDGALVAALARLAGAGYRIALDDFTFHPRWRPVLELAHVVKVDVRALGLEQVRAQVEQLAGYDVELLAEKVERVDEYHALRAMGFHAYQGYLFARPGALPALRAPAAGGCAELELLRVLRDSRNGVDAVAALLARDASLGVRVMRLVESACQRLPARITSIRRAVAHLGLAALERWATLMVLSADPARRAARGHADTAGGAGAWPRVSGLRAA